MKTRAKPGEARAFIKHASEYTGDACLLWPFGCNSAGYGHVGGKDGWKLVHRLVCEAVNGPAPDGLIECAHLCGNGHLGCCAPKHLAWKSRKGNAEDMAAHGRSQRGAKQHMAKLTAADVRFIRANYSSLGKRKLARRLGVSPAAVYYAAIGKSWAWLDAAERGVRLRDLEGGSLQ